MSIEKLPILFHSNSSMDSKHSWVIGCNVKNISHLRRGTYLLPWIWMSLTVFVVR